MHSIALLRCRVATFARNGSLPPPAVARTSPAASFDAKAEVLNGLVTRKDLLKVPASVARNEGEREAYFGHSGKPA